MTQPTDNKQMSQQSPANIAQQLQGVDFPASKEDLVRQARDKHAELSVLDALENIPEQEYRNISDVMKGLKRAA